MAQDPLGSCVSASPVTFVLLNLRKTSSHLTFQQHSTQLTHLLEIPSSTFSSYLWLHVLKLLSWASFFCLTSKFCCYSRLSLNPLLASKVLHNLSSAFLVNSLLHANPKCSGHIKHLILCCPLLKLGSALFPRMPTFPPSNFPHCVRFKEHQTSQHLIGCFPQIFLCMAVSPFSSLSPCPTRFSPFIRGCHPVLQ